jgi:hypothetical protein
MTKHIHSLESTQHRQFQVIENRFQSNSTETDKLYIERIYSETDKPEYLLDQTSESTCQLYSGACQIYYRDDIGNGRFIYYIHLPKTIEHVELMCVIVLKQSRYVCTASRFYIGIPCRSFNTDMVNHQTTMSNDDMIKQNMIQEFIEQEKYISNSGKVYFSAGEIQEIPIYLSDQESACLSILQSNSDPKILTILLQNNVDPWVSTMTNALLL